MKGEKNIVNTKSTEDYLETIYKYKTPTGTSSVDVARSLNVTKAAVNLAINDLIKRGYVTKEPYRKIFLTKEGEKIAKSVYARHLVIKQFLLKIGVDEENAEKDCCEMEHSISDVTFEKLKKFLYSMQNL